MIASPDLRSPMKDQLSKTRSLRVCALEYRAPDVLLGHGSYGSEVDMWSVGCIAVEAITKKRLFNKEGEDSSQYETLKDTKSILEQQWSFVGTPPVKSPEHAWFSELPLMFKYCGKNLPRCTWEWAVVNWPAELLLDDSKMDFVKNTLRPFPQHRLDAASACQHPFLVPHRRLEVAVSAQAAKNGLGTVLTGRVDEDLLQYMQGCPSNVQLYDATVQSDFAPANCMKEEGLRRCKSEFPGYLDADNPPPCKQLNSDTLKPIFSRRLKKFGKAMRRLNREWLHQLTCRIRRKLVRGGCLWKSWARTAKSSYSKTSRTWPSSTCPNSS